MQTDVLRMRYSMLLLIALLGGLAYANSFSVPFQFDDEAYIINNPIIRTFHYFFSPSEVYSLTESSPISVPTAIRHVFLTRIAGFVTFAFNYQLHGLDVAGYHVVNLIIHILNGILIYLIVTAILETDHFAPLVSTSPVSASVISIFPALLFVSHPLQTQAVTYISQRFASLAAFFFLFSLLCYFRSRTAHLGGMRRLFYAASLCSAFTAMLTKEFAITLPFITVLFDMTFLSGTTGARIRRLAPLGITALIIPLLVFGQKGSLQALDSTMRTMTAAAETSIPRIHYLLTQIKVLPLYLRLLVFPANQNVDHDVPVATSLADLSVVLPLAGLLSLFGAAVALYLLSVRKREYPELRLAAFGIFWFFATLSVESSVIPLGELVAEYRVYLPSVGIAIAVVAVAVHAVRRVVEEERLRRILLFGLFGTAVVVLAIATHLRNEVWSSEIALWEDAARKSPMKVRPHQNLGTHYSMQGRYAEAKRELLLALRLAPRDPELYNNLGIVHRKLGEFPQAIQAYQAVLKIAPDDAMARYNLGNVYLSMGNLEEAIRIYQSTMALIPDYDEVHNNLGVAYDRSGRLPKAISAYRRALSLNPENRSARKNLDLALKKAGHSGK